jgi:CRP/FNR family cyclic AMP-dependent transcriptional regulator
MASSLAPSERHAPLEDVLEHLPISSTTEYRKGQTIYSPGRCSKSIYLVIAGKVELSQIAEDGSEVLLEIVRANELFGESAFLAAPPSERATAFENVKLMTWPAACIEDLVIKRPRLAVALLQVLAQRNAELGRRIESFAIDSIERRLARSLLRFSERLGTPEEDGSVRLMPFTHALLSRYVGTSREVVTLHMNRLRKQGFVRYSRRGIFLVRDASQAPDGESDSPAS